MASRMCEMCPLGSPTVAVVYCDADACYLCATCDEDVHQANRLAQRHVRRPVGPADVVPSPTSETDVVVPDVAEKAEPIHQALPAVVGATAEPVFADFEEFEGMTFGKMPVLAGVDADAQFMALTHGDALKAFDAEDLWDQVVPEEFDHVVPDIECMSPLTGEAPGVRSEIEGLMPPADKDAMVPAIPVVPTSTHPTGVVSRPNHSKSKGTYDSSAISSAAMAAILSPSANFGKNPLSGFPSSPVSVSGAGQLSGDASPVESDSKADCELELKSVEERKQMRMEALARFRSKRANRSFQKKIRYGCRKVLAESRPRVKGRFVRKADMALYRRYGANYADFKGLPGALDGVDVDGTGVKQAC